MSINNGKGVVPVNKAANYLGMSPRNLKTGIILGLIPIGYAVRDGEHITDVAALDDGKGRIRYYIFLKQLLDFAGEDVENGNV